MSTLGTGRGNPCLGRKYIKSFASGIAYQFACSAQHFAWLAYHLRIPAVTIDLLEPRIAPGGFDIERNRILAGMCRQTLLRSAERLAAPGAVISAVLSARFEIEAALAGEPCSLGGVVVTVCLTDDRGKEWRAEHAERWILMQP